MYLLEDKLKRKYRSRFSTLFAPEFMERVRALDRVRGLRQLLTPFPGVGQDLSEKRDGSRLYYVFDASAIHHLYAANEDLTPKLDHFVEQRGLGKAFLFVPNFCVAETFNTFAKLRYRKHELSEEQYKVCREAFAQDIHNGELFYHYELNRYHVLYVDYIIPFEHLFQPQRPKGTRKGEEWTLSTFDILIIAVGMELARITAGYTYLITCDRRLHKINQVLLGLTGEQRCQHGIPSYVRFPQSLYLWEKQLIELPYVEGQRVDL